MKGLNNDEKQGRVLVCPSCGSKEVKIRTDTLLATHRTPTRYYWVECDGCQLQTRLARTARRAMMYWNRAARYVAYRDLAAILNAYRDRTE